MADARPKLADGENLLSHKEQPALEGGIVEGGIPQEKCVYGKIENLAAINLKLIAELEFASTREAALQERIRELEDSLARSYRRTDDLKIHNEGSLKSISDLEAERLVASMENAVASVSIARLEDRDTELVSMNVTLARANAISAELVCDLQAQAFELREALERVRVLQGLISICMHCHKIREDGNVWNRLEEYMVKHTDVRFSHGLCPPCLESHYP